MGTKIQEKIRAEADAAGIEKIPRHIAIIMDGNNRWAKKRHLPGAAGHKAGLDTIREVMEVSSTLGVETLTLFAFSSENWQRPRDEVSALMTLFLNALQREIKRLHKNNIRVRLIGRRDRFSPSIQKHIAEAEAMTAENTGCTVVVAADYGGHWDIAQAARCVAQRVADGELAVEEIEPDVLQQSVCIGDLPPPDLCIRTGGEQRISNFLLWQMAYTELYFTETYWPDFDKEALLEAMRDYSQRERRFGRTSNSVSDGADSGHAS